MEEKAMKRGKLFLLALLALVIVLGAACGPTATPQAEGGTEETGAQPTEAPAAETGGMMTEIGPGEGTVSIVAWPGYIERGETDPAYDWVTGFEEETGCAVEVRTARSEEHTS